ncbi:uncharacterized protein LOC119484926 [Sebastes umbrosus]|uniref:uncharacterized protein LOC119484926 n=1 Tax=Sebastes umbrosus TaxID=72105 RepID=UPI0018A0360A|nr:uncharacterized protein LOC119484926 [Sebastes umbrosus]
MLIQEKDKGAHVIECKFYISDEYINNLDPDDSGCSCESAQPGTHHSVAEENIKSDLPTLQKTTTPIVKSAEKLTKTTETNPTRQQNTASSATSKKRSGDPMKPGEIAAAVVCPALLLTLVLVLILCRHKLPRTQVCCAAGGSSEQRTNAEHNTEGNQGDHHYEEIQMQNQQASSGDALPSVYATVNLPVDQLQYAGIKFQEKSFIVSTDGNALPEANKNVSSACVNSSISSSQGDTHPPAAQQTLYSTVTIAKPGKA